MAMVKNWIAAKNVTFQLLGVRKLAEETLAFMNKKECLSVCKHIHEVEDKYMQNDHLVDSIVEGLVLSLESSDSKTRMISVRKAYFPSSNLG
jgi:hypothetical protein